MGEPSEATTSVGDVVRAAFPTGFRSVRRFVVASAHRDDPYLENFLTLYATHRKRVKSDSLHRAWSKDDRINFHRPPRTPFDAFAVAASLLTKSGAYHHIEPYCLENEEYAEDRAQTRVIVVNAKDREVCVKEGETWAQHLLFDEHEHRAEKLINVWTEIRNAFQEPVFQFLPDDKSAPQWWKNAHELLMIADRAARFVGFDPQEFSHDKFTPWAIVSNIASAFRNRTGAVTRYYSLSMANADLLCVTPKSVTAELGCTLRSLSHNLAFVPPRGLVRCKWKSAAVTPVATEATSRTIANSCDDILNNRAAFNLLVVPFPYTVHANDFRATSIVEEPDRKWGNFKAHPYDFRGETGGRKRAEFIRFLMELVDNARREVGSLNGIVLPELSISARAYQQIKTNIIHPSEDLEFMAAGLYERPVIRGEHLGHPENANGYFGAKYDGNIAAMYALDRSTNAIRETSHRKHHRWRLNASQIQDYGLGAALDPSLLWWEDIRTVNREVPVFVMHGQWTVTTLICEDLARVDPAQEVLRAIGPNLVVALLMDGAQIRERWPARYATVLGEDPGSAVLTLTSLGLINRVNGLQRYPESRAIGLWQDKRSGVIPLNLPADAQALVLTLSASRENAVTMDGRGNDATSFALRLSGVVPVSSKRFSPPSWGA